MIEKSEQEPAVPARSPFDRIRQEGRKQAAEAREHLVEFARRHQRQWSGRLATYEHALHQTADTLRQDDGYPIANYTDRAADGLGRLSRTLRESDPRELLGKIEEYARKQPAVALGVAIGAGLVLGRFLRNIHAAAQPSATGGATPSQQEASASAQADAKAGQSSGAEGAASRPSVGSGAAPSRRR
jgi:hypothetical protein